MTQARAIAIVLRFLLDAVATQIESDESCWDAWLAVAQPKKQRRLVLEQRGFSTRPPYACPHGGTPAFAAIYKSGT